MPGLMFFCFLARVLRTGVHTVADVHCLGCNDRIGWYYFKASNNSQRYKEGEHWTGFIPVVILRMVREVHAGKREVGQGKFLANQRILADGHMYDRHGFCKMILLEHSSPHFSGESRICKIPPSHASISCHPQPCHRPSQSSSPPP